MLKSALPIAIAIFAAPALAQTGGAPAGQSMAPPPEFITAAQAYGQCIGGKARGQPATVTPEAAATAALAGCAAERGALDTRFEAWVASPGFPEAARVPAREQYKAQMAGAQAQIATKIRESRTSAAPAPSPTPASR